MNINMKTVVVTDCKYRSSIAAVRSLGKAGYGVVAVSARGDTKSEPPAFYSKYVKRRVMLNGKAGDEEYENALISLLSEYDCPVLFPIGAKTIESISKNIDEYSSVCSFNVAASDILDKANDKQYVTRLANGLGIPTPAEYDIESPSFPCIIKPRCGEKAGLKAAKRYIKCYNKEQYDVAYKKMSSYDPFPIVESLITGEGVGISLLMDKDGRGASVICHKRIREYPIGGGPSTCLESIYDEKLVSYAEKLLHALDFRGIAMVEFKGGQLLEINPRIWGSFPMTEYAGSNFACNYVKSALGQSFDAIDTEYKRGAKMHFAVNDAVCLFSLIAHGRMGSALCCIADFINPHVRDGLRDNDDKKPFYVYLRQLFK